MKISKVNNIFHLNRLKGKTSNFENVALQYCSLKTNVVLNILHEIFSYTCCYYFFKTLFKYIICLCCMLLAILKKWKQVSSFFFFKVFLSDLANYLPWKYVNDTTVKILLCFEEDKWTGEEEHRAKTHFLVTISWHFFINHYDPSFLLEPFA